MRKVVFALVLLQSALVASTLSMARPNVLFIMADDLNSALSGYGHPQCKTPNLDKLALRGTTFTRAYCQYPLCGPSRASIMSGLYPMTNKVTSNGGVLKIDTPTMPELFRNNGYWTGRCGKIYHMGVPGNIMTGDPGTDHAASWDVTHNVRVMETLTPGKAEDVMLTDSTAIYEEYRKKWKSRGEGGVFTIKHGNHQGSDMVIVEATVPDAELADGYTAGKAIELLRERGTDKKPFFLAVGFVRPHVPFVAPERSFKQYRVEAMKLAEVPEGDLDDMPSAAKQQANASKYKMDENDQRKSLRGYYASVSYMDEQVGRLLDELDALKLRDNTIVVFVSDHGFHLGEHTLWQKQSLMEESVRVPLIMSVPKSVSLPGNRRPTAKSSRVVELIDLYPTLASLAALKPPDGLEGESLVPAIAGDEQGAEDEVALIQVRGGWCLRTSKWAFMRYGKQGATTEFMLYDMEKDSRQLTNLANDPEHQMVLQQFKSMLSKM